MQLLEFCRDFIEVSGDHKGLESVHNMQSCFPSPCFSWQVFKLRLCAAPACHGLTGSLRPAGGVPVLLWVHECESLRVACHVEFKTAVKEHG